MEGFQHVVDFIPRIEQLAMKYEKRHREDMVANAVLTLIEKNGNYKPEVAEYDAWASRVAKCSMILFRLNTHMVRVCRATQERRREGKYQEHSFKSESVRHATRPTVNIDSLIYLKDPHAHKFQDAVDQRDHLERINKTKKKLTKQQRRLLQLRYSAGLTAIETAKAMNLTRQRVNQIEGVTMFEMRKRLWR